MLRRVRRRPLPPLRPSRRSRSCRTTPNAKNSSRRSRRLPKTSSPVATPEPAPVVSADNLGVQVMVQVSNWFGEVSNQLANAARAVTDFPMILQWSVQLAKDPYTRHILLDTAWKLALVLACALAIEWLVRRVLRRPLGAINRYIPVRNRPAAPEPETGNAVPAQDLGHELKRHRTLAYAWQLLMRLPFVLARLALDLAPVLAFAAIGNMLLATEIGTAVTPRVIILAMVNAYVLCRAVLAIVGALISPAANQPSLFVIRDETAAYITIWARRLVVVAVFGVALANVALMLGLYRPAYFATVRIVVLIVHLLLLVVTLQCRQAVADLHQGAG